MALNSSVPGASGLLVTLGIVTVNWNERRDSVANFVPFVAQALKRAQDDVITVSAVQEAIEQSIGLKIPQGALNTILRRASREGYVTISHGVMYPNKDALANFDMEPKRGEVERQRSALLTRLRAFAETEFKTAWTLEETERVLLGYVSDQAAPLLATTVGGVPFQPYGSGRHTEVVVNRFVHSLCTQDLVGLEYLETFVKGSMLANVLYLPEGFRSIERHFGSTQICLDTSLVLLAIGYTEIAIAQSVRELVELLQRFDASLCIFDHTLREIEGILDNAAMHLRTGNSKGYEGSVLEYFVMEGMTAADAERAIAALPVQLARRGIEVIDAPPHSESLGLDENRLATILQETVPNYRQEPLYRDIDSLTAVYRLRKGQSFARLESCPALFVTTNKALAKASHKYFHEVYGRQTIPVCLDDHTMTTIAWLKDPVGASDLPRKQMIADSFAAMNPSDKIWRRYLNEAERLRDQGEISESDFVLLRYSMEARHALISVTHGEAEVFTEGTVPEVLAKARSNAAAEAEIQGRNAALAAQTDRYQELSRGGATILAGVAFMTAALALIVGLTVTTNLLLPPDWNVTTPPILVSVCVAAALVAALLHTIAGLSLVDLAKSLHRVLAGGLFWLLSSFFAPRNKDHKSSGSAGLDADLA
jgi:hypothetical protein